MVKKTWEDILTRAYSNVYAFNLVRTVQMTAMDREEALCTLLCVMMDEIDNKNKIINDLLMRIRVSPEILGIFESPKREENHV